MATATATIADPPYPQQGPRAPRSQARPGAAGCRRRRCGRRQFPGRPVRRIASKPSTGRKPSSSCRAGERSPRRSVLAAALEGCGKVQEPSCVDAVGRDDGSDRRMAAVSVPVLSKTTVSRRPADSRDSPPRNEDPASAPLPVADHDRRRVARPMAQGPGDDPRRRMKAVSASVTRGSAAAEEPDSEGQAARTSTAGTKTSLIRSAIRWIGAFDPWARWTSSTIRASAVSRRPSPFASRMSPWC